MKQLSGRENAPMGVTRVATLLSEMGEELRSVVASSGEKFGIASLLSSLEHDNVVTLLTPDEHVAADALSSHIPINIPYLRTLLSQLAEALVQVGAPARAEQLREATNGVYAEMADRATSADVTPDARADVILIVRCIRMLHVQLQLLKMDLANAKLRLLIVSMGT